MVVEMSAIPGVAADCFTTDSVVRERTCTVPHKKDLYCFTVPDNIMKFR